MTVGPTGGGGVPGTLGSGASIQAAATTKSVSALSRNAEFMSPCSIGRCPYSYQV